jgi:hypothetical protein
MLEKSPLAAHQLKTSSPADRWCCSGVGRPDVSYRRFLITATAHG